MPSKMWWQRSNQRLGFFQDERSQQVHLISVRNGYFMILVMALFVSTYQEFLTERTGVLGVTVLFIWLSLSILAGRWFQLNRLSAMDEHLDSQMAKSFRYAYLFLNLSIFLQASYRAWIVEDTLGLMAWNACLLSGLCVILLTQIIKNTLLGHLWVWLALMTVFTGMIAWNIYLIVPFILNLMRSGGSLSMLLLVLLGFAPVLAIATVFSLATWRSWQNEKGHLDGK